MANDPRSEFVLPSTALRVLVVDDNRDVADSQALLLSLWGYDARVAYDGLTALAVAPHYQPHVVLLDIGLPSLDGWEVARRLHDVGLTQALFLAVTAYDAIEEDARSRAAEFDGHFLKPVDPVALQQRLAKLARSASEGCPR